MVRYYHIHTSVPPNPQTHIPPGGMHVVVVGRTQAPPPWEPPLAAEPPPPPRTPSSRPPPPPHTQNASPLYPILPGRRRVQSPHPVRMAWSRTNLRFYRPTVCLGPRLFGRPSIRLPHPRLFGRSTTTTTGPDATPPPPKPYSNLGGGVGARGAVWGGQLEDIPILTKLQPAPMLPPMVQ